MIELPENSVKVAEVVEAAYIADICDIEISLQQQLAGRMHAFDIDVFRRGQLHEPFESNIDTPTVVIELADSTRAGVFKPVYDDKRISEVLMLLMQMMITA